MAPGFLQKAVALGACLFGTLSLEDFGVSGALVTTSTKSATLTALNQNSEIASVELLENGNDNRISTVNDFRCTQNNYDTFCVKLDIFNTGCQGIETLELLVYGGQVGTSTASNADLYSLFSMLGSDGKVDFLSYLSDWSGGVNIVNGGINGGVFEAPVCGRNTLMKYNDNNDIIGTIWDRMGTSTNARESRKIPVNQNLDNWNHLTSEKIGVGTSPIKFTLINDLISNTLTTIFEADTITPVTCIYNTAFDTKTGNNYAIGFQTDQGIVKLSQFDVKMTCQEPEPACDSTPLDIYFSMDASDSVGTSNFDLMKEFVTDLIENEVDIDSHIAVNHFAKGAWTDWQFTQTQNPRTQMINTINNIIYPIDNARTFTKDAIQLVINEYKLNGRSLNEADRLLVFLTDGKPWPDTQTPCDLKSELDELNIKVLLVGIGNGWITQGGRDIMKCMVDDVSNDMIHVKEFSQAAFDQVKERVTQSVCPKCDYTHTCHAMGDPHIRTFDGTLYHFQGSGYFDYLTGCTMNDKKHLPVTISALQVQVPNRPKVTRIEQVVVSLSDGFDPYALQIIFPRSGTNPTFRNGVSAIGKHSFFNNKYETIISNGNFEVLFYLNDGSGRRGKIKFTYKGTTLNIETSDCLSEYLCGLCGSLTNDPTDDFETCDTQETLSNEGVSAYWQLATRAQRITARDNVNTFGNSCCNKDLDNEYLGTSDCTVSNPVIDDCIDTDISYNLCLKAWNNFCSNCKDTSPSEEWLINCAYDICLETTCKEKITNELNGGSIFTFSQAENLGCLDTVSSECEVNCPVIKPPVRTLCDDIYDSVLNSNIDAVPFYQWWNNKIGNHFYTHNAAFDGIASNYVSQGISGYIWKGAINGGFTVPFYRFKTNDNGIIDHFYGDNGEGISSVDEDDHKHTISLYEYEGIAGYIMKTHCSDFNQPLYRYWSDLYNDHFYTTDYRDNYPGYIFENVAGYVAREAM